MPEPCDRPPAGWTCSREPGHSGPCAARHTWNVTNPCNLCGHSPIEHYPSCPYRQTAEAMIQLSQALELLAKEYGDLLAYTKVLEKDLNPPHGIH